MRRAAVLVCVVVLLAAGPSPAAAGDDGCGDLSGSCGVTGGATHFHGVLAVAGAAWVLDASASARNGCSDCSWSMVPACVTQQTGQPDTLCDGAGAAPTCDPGQILYRLYLSTAAFIDRDEGVLCIGGANHPIPVGDISTADVGRYLDNVAPPNLTITTRPNRATLAGLITYFRATAPADLHPTPFGGPDVTETITISPVAVQWRWGDGGSTGWTDLGTQTHRYLSGGVASGSVTSRWQATYTVSYAGRTFGPYDATRDVAHTQRFRLPVRTSSPTLVSH